MTTPQHLPVPTRLNGKPVRRAAPAAATVPVPSSRLELALAVHAPTHDEIAARAYYLWEASGRTTNAEQNWFEAERQLWDEYWYGAPAPRPVRSNGAIPYGEH